MNQNQDPGVRIAMRMVNPNLPPRLREVAEVYGTLSTWIVGNIPPGAERTVALRKLRESKDCAVIARVEGDEST